jgi:hypothetical protein
MHCAAIARQIVKTSLQHIIYDNVLKTQLILGNKPYTSYTENFTQNLNLNKIKDFTIFLHQYLVFNM